MGIEHPCSTLTVTSCGMEDQMASRHREYNLSTTKSGTLWLSLGNQTINRTATNLVRGYSDDVVGNMGGENALLLQRDLTHVPLLNGEEWYTSWNGTKTLLAKYTSCPITWQPPPKSPLTAFPAPTESWLLAQAPSIVAQANPSRPHVSAPTFIGELKDIPQLVYGWGKSLLHRLAAGYIQYRWAYRPMVADVKRMLSFQAAVCVRMQQLQRLASGKTISVKVGLGVDNANATEQVTAESQRASVILWRDTQYQRKHWAVVKWRMNEISQRDWGDREHRGVGEMMNYTDRILSGVTSQEALATAWELTPWSWFADWFGNFGDIIAAANNSVGAYPVAVLYMRTTSSTSSYRLKSKSSWVELDSMPMEDRTYKGRWIVPTIGYLLPTVGMPILTGRQWSILGALAALKVTR